MIKYLKFFPILFLLFFFFNQTFVTAFNERNSYIFEITSEGSKGSIEHSRREGIPVEYFESLRDQCTEFLCGDKEDHDEKDIFDKIFAIDIYELACRLSHTPDEEVTSGYLNYQVLVSAYSLSLLKFGAQCQEKGDEERARECFLKSLEIDSQWGVVEGIPAFYMCNSCLKKKMSKACENCEAIERILENNSDNDEALCHSFNHFGRGCLKVGNYAKAKDLFLKVLAIDSDNFHACKGLSFIYGIEEDDEKLNECLLKCFEINPDDSGVKRQLLVRGYSVGS